MSPLAVDQFWYEKSCCVSQSDICKFRLLDCLLITHFQVGHIFFRPRLCEVIFEYIDLYMHASLFLYFE